MASHPGARLTVRPGRPLAGSFRPPGDKSITHRAYLMGLVATGETVVVDPNPGADCEATLACAGILGATVSRRDQTVTIAGTSGTLREPDRVLDCGNSGTTLRLLAGVLASQPFFSVLAGDESLHRRPVARIVEPLRTMGAQLWARDGDRLPPLAIRGGALAAIEYRVPVASAQVASCILLAALAAPGRTVVTMPGAARDHTQRMLGAFGVKVEVALDGRSIALNGPASLLGTQVRIPGDVSAAAFFLAAAATIPGASVTARDVSVNPTRAGLLAVMERMGARVERARPREEGGDPIADVTVTGPARLEAIDIQPDEVPSLIDEVPAWAVLATAARGTSRIAGAAELRVKESDRLAALARNLGRLGITVEETRDGLAVTGGEPRGGTVDAEEDHRIAMAFAILGARAAGPVTITGAGGIPTSYPDFLTTFAALGGEVEGAHAVVGR
ncbi:MAG TPA: 3-phosphoshikimate 1-carboxyvinyltransferase [Candidatus Eisenbacteria bacterium]|nr:3-phosphoshikimate 1-carboxyvinyltransferase [Candidatus Eisenbacteria bacterium]